LPQHLTGPALRHREDVTHMRHRLTANHRA
jgi:hypothetical protein